MGAGTAARNIGIWGFTTAQDAAGRGQSLLDQAKSGSLAALGQARTDLNSQYGGAIDRLNPWVSAGTNALGTYQNSLGLNGADGNAAAVAAFQASPGYQYQVDQATDAVARKASALGALGSGNTAAAISDRAQNLANTEFGGWQDRLNGLSNTGLTAANAQAGYQTGLGNQLANLGSTEAGLGAQYAGLGLNNLWQGTTAGLNAVQGGQKQAADAVASRNSLTANIIGSGIGLLGMGMGGGQTLGGNLINWARGV